MSDATKDQGTTPLELRDSFPVPTLDEWHEECVRLLKGIPFEKKMVTRTHEGITLKAMYTKADLEGLPHLESAPGAAPYVRGTRPLGYRQQPWQVAQEIPYPDYEKFNAALRHDLKRGQTAAVLVLDEASQAGLDPDQAAPEMVGKNGTSVASLRGLTRALDGVDLAAVPIHIESGAGALTYAALLVALARKRGVSASQLRGSVGLDPVAGLAELGQLPLSLEKAYDELAILTGWAGENTPSLQTVAARGHVYHDGGASAVQELALTLSAAVQHMRELDKRGLDVENVAPRIRFSFSVGTHFFMEIARLRAARLLWSRIVEAAGGSESARQMTIGARTSRFTKTVLDPHVNMLRSTTEAMAAIFGQVDSLHVAPFDEPIGLPDEFSCRIARNTQIMLRDECHFDLVGDPAGGSWYVEKLTAEVAEKAWALFQEIEAAGGMVEALKSGKVQSLVAETADSRRKALAIRKDIQVGTNQYPNATEEPCEGRGVDHQALYKMRSKVMQELRTSGEHQDNLTVLKKLESILQGEGPQVFESIVEAAAAGATVGELSGTFRHDADPQMTVDTIVPWRAGEMFERLRGAVKSHADDKATTVFCANLGNVARYMPRLDFTRGFFQTGGFTVDADRFFKSPTEAAEAAWQSNAKTVVLVGLDDTYAEQAVETVKQIKARGKQTVLLAGMPKAMADELKAAGLNDFIHARCDAHQVLSELAASKGVAL